ncbi:MAG: permease [Anaerolineaceae bacterium]|nr:permease [Anaerolineaceae bacterium]
MITELQFLFNFVVESLLSIWPYLLITIPVAVAVQLSGASRYIRRALTARPMLAIVLATAVGAFSPFCSCTVIPVVAALLIGGVPLAPVMAFWIASPSMDPETFFLSVATIGWNMAVWRLAATLVLSLAAGYVTHLAVSRSWLGEQILRDKASAQAVSVVSLTDRLVAGWRKFVAWLGELVPSQTVLATSSGISFGSPSPEPAETASCSGETTCAVPVESEAASCGTSCAVPQPFKKRLLQETWAATSLVLRFMLLAFVLEALIIRYVPAVWITGLLGQQNPLAIVWAALIGVPVYTSNLAALPMVSGLLAQGMNPAAGLAFLVAGPTTTLPAMTAVWQLASRRVFVLYVAFALVGAVVAGYTYQLFAG